MFICIYSSFSLQLLSILTFTYVTTYKKFTLLSPGVSLECLIEQSWYLYSSKEYISVVEHKCGIIYVEFDKKQVHSQRVMK